MARSNHKFSISPDREFHFHHLLPMRSVIAALRSRAIVKEIFAEPGLLRTASQGEIMAAVAEIVETNPFYARTFLSEFVRWAESEEAEEEEGEVDVDDQVGVEGGVEGREDFESKREGSVGAEVENGGIARPDLHPKVIDSSCESAVEDGESRKAGEKKEGDEKEAGIDDLDGFKSLSVGEKANSAVDGPNSGVTPVTANPKDKPSQGIDNPQEQTYQLYGENCEEKLTSFLASNKFTRDLGPDYAEASHTDTTDHSSSGSEILHEDEIDPYELLCSLLSAKPLPPTAPDILQYPIDFSSSWISIKETPRVISGQGTTGARTWNAAQLLALILNTESRFAGEFQGKTVLELGAGTGLVSLALAQKWEQHGFRKIIVTDGDEGVVDKLPDIIELNGLENENLECMQFLWDTTPIPPNVDIVLGADIVYDPSVLDMLINTIRGFLESGASYAVISRSDRNPDTSKQWEVMCDEAFHREVIRVEDPRNSTLPCWFHGGANDITVEVLSTKRV